MQAKYHARTAWAIPVIGRICERRPATGIAGRDAGMGHARDIPGVVRPQRGSRSSGAQGGRWPRVGHGGGESSGLRAAEGVEEAARRPS